MAHASRLLSPAAAAPRYEDPAGRVLPDEIGRFLDTWKRPEELVLTSPVLPPVLLKGAPGQEAAPAKGESRSSAESRSRCSRCAGIRWAGCQPGAVPP